MESVSLLQTAIRSRKDAVRVLHQARQLAQFLRFNTLDQIEIGCHTFALALGIAANRAGAAVIFQLCQDSLQIGTIPALKKNAAAAIQVSRTLPESMALSRDDFIWVIAQLQLLLKVDALNVIKQQNEDLLEISQALRDCQRELHELRDTAAKSPAA